MSAKCVECGNSAEPNMVAHARRHKQGVLCRGCDERLSADLGGSGG